MDILKIGSVLLMVIVLLRKRMHMATVMSIGAVSMALLFGMGLHEIGMTALGTVVHASTMHTALVLLLIMVLENLMRRYMLLERLVGALKLILKDYRMVMPLPPVFLGLLPSAGGALFSAPMVNSACADYPVTAERKGVINFWFRHVWECVLPLYPAMIIACEVMEVEMTRFVWNTYPFTLLAIILGTPYLIFQQKRAGILKTDRNTDAPAAPQKATSTCQDLMWGILPIVIVLLLYFIIGIPLAAALGLVITLMAVVLRIPLHDWLRLIRESVSLKIILILFSIMAFKNVLETSGAVYSLVSFFSSLGVSLTLLAILLPFAVAFLTGMSQAYVAITFPILLGMIPEVDLPLMALAYVSGFAGLMLSPMHLCLVLTAEFFRAQMGRMMVMMIPPLSIMVMAGWLLAWIR